MTMFPTLCKGTMVFGVALLILGMASCSKKAPEQTETPPPPGSNLALVKALGDSIQKITLGAADGPQLIIVPSLAGRVMGASIEGDAGENLMWVDSTILDGMYFTVQPPKWNAGGLRTWLAPEDLFFLPPEKEASKWFVPAELDPAPYTVAAQSGNEVTMELTTNLPANIGKTYNVKLTRRITLLSSFSDSTVGALPAGVTYMGINQFHSLENLSDQIIGKDLPPVCLWSLLQTHPSGTMLIPIAPNADPAKAYREYFNPLGPDRIAVENGIISVKIDGQYRSKIGVNGPSAGKGIAFLRDDGNGQGVLMVQLFAVDPKGTYVDKPWGKPSNYGDAIEMYNDDGKMGGFCELECHGPAKVLKKGEVQSHDMVLHIFKGPIPELQRIGTMLLGADLTKAKYFTL
jgi:hypothetical protein